MKKPILVLNLITSFIFTACSSDDDGGIKVNTPPESVILEIAENNANTSVNFSWNASTDIDGDAIIYDFYVNNEILAANITALQYVWEINGEVNHIYPATFKVVAKDIEGSSDDSNVLEVRDPLIGKWLLEKSIENDVEENLTDCDKLSTLEFYEDGTYEGNQRYQEVVGGECLEDIYGGIWSNKTEKIYGFLYPEETEDDLYTIEFTNTTFTIISSALDLDEVINERITYKLVE